MTDRRRINGPATGVHTPIFTSLETSPTPRIRPANTLRQLFLSTHLLPHAAGSAYLELSPSAPATTFTCQTSTLKLSCAIQGPKPLSRNAPFSPNLQINATVKFAPFATPTRRGWIRDSVERDLSVHLEMSIRGIVITDRYPKSSLDVSVTVLEGEDGVGLLNVLAGCVNVAVAALCDASIDMLDVAAAGVAACVTKPDTTATESDKSVILLDPCPSEHAERDILSAAVVVYLPSRDEIVDLWCKCSSGTEGQLDETVDAAVKAARGVQRIIKEVVLEGAERAQKRAGNDKRSAQDTDVQMKT